MIGQPTTTREGSHRDFVDRKKLNERSFIDIYGSKELVSGTLAAFPFPVLHQSCNHAGVYFYS